MNKKVSKKLKKEEKAKKSKAPKKSAKKKRGNPFDKMPLEKQIATARKLAKKAPNSGFKKYWENKLKELEKKKR